MMNSPPDDRAAPRPGFIVPALVDPNGMLAAVLAALCVALALTTSNFLTVGNLINVVRQISLNGILAVGVTYCQDCGMDDTLGASP